MITTAVILARGLGTRMRAASDSAALSEEQARAADAGMKAMMPIGRPFLDYVLSALADGGITDVCLVIGPEHDVIRDYYDKEVRPTRVALHFAVQQVARGTADAVLAARSVTRERDFLVLNADNYYPVTAYRALVNAGAPSLPGFNADTLVRRGNIGAGRIRKYALLRVGADGLLEDVLEKPDEATFAAMGSDALVSMNLWAFTPEIFEACRRVRPSARGELEIPNAVRLAVREMGMRFRVIPMAEGVLDLSSRGDVASVAAALADVEVRL